ncbi:MAG: ATP-dependent DNA helicase RecG [bacterium]|nr:ATP-dependent DNA helicase RecG [bacterium]
MEAGKSEGMQLTELPGIGNRIAARFESLGIYNARDLIFLLPRAYQDRTHPQLIPAVNEGQFATIRGQIMSISERGYRSRKTLEVMISDGHGVILLKWFRFGRWLKANIEKKYPPGTQVLASGRVSSFSGSLEMHHPDLSEASKNSGGGIVPVYPLADGISQQTVRKAVQTAVSQLLNTVSDEIPENIRKEYNLPDLKESLAGLHEPPDTDDVQALNLGASCWHRRLKFGELLTFQLGLLTRRRALDSRRSHPVTPVSSLEKKLIRVLPFDLTRSQLDALQDVGRDMAAKVPMHRLLQGDVGCGKTLVAFISMLRVCEAGYQAVLMAPTEVLAEQHYRTISKWCELLGVPVALLTGNVDGKQRKEVLMKAISGETKLFIGTHALIQEGVQFKNLNLAIVDEQHRFGVLQRLALGRKGASPHFLVMTATPIPRSLSMVIYGDLDITTINEMPAGRTPVETVIFKESDRSRMHLSVAREVEAGRQVYIVYPLVEETEKLELLAAREMAENYRQRIFPHLSIGLLTGRMTSREKDSVMEQFRAGDYQVLVSTTVIEVGVDVPNANLMVIEHAERFGLFQLHQLRGRVGRGTNRSTCILMEGAKSSDEARQRLQIISKTNSGFEIAEADLDIRGPGDFLGVRQAGMPEFRFAHPFREGELMSGAREAAFKMLPEGAQLPTGMLEEVRRMWSEEVSTTTSG